MGEKTKYPPPYSLRLTFEERQRLDRDAGNMPISAYIREQLFDKPSTRRQYNRATKEQEFFKEILKALAETRISSNLNQLAKASNEGRLILDPDTKRSLDQACADMHEIRAEIIRSMGLKPPKGGAP